MTLASESVGKTLVCSADIYCPNNGLDLQINSNGYATTNVPQNESFHTYTVSKEIVSTNTGILINLKSAEYELDCYIDNLKCYIQ